MGKWTGSGTRGGLRWLLMGLLCLALAPAQVQAQAADRLALVIGNDAYQHPRVPTLKNAGNDARAVAAKLRADPLGFEVIEAYDLTAAQMRNRLQAFGRRLKESGRIGFFYYAGHGAQVSLDGGIGDVGDNLLMGVDVDISTEDEMREGSLKLSDGSDSVLEVMRRGGRSINLVVLDACRDNPALDARGGTRGLRPVSPPKDRGRVSFLIQYSTAAGQTASDQPFASNSVYTRELLSWLDQPVSIEDAFTEVAGAVKRQTGQEPWKIGNLGERVFLVGTGPARPAPGPVVDPLAVELEYWRGVQGLGTVEAYRDYLARYPRGQFVRLAEGQIAKLSEPGRREPGPVPVSSVPLPVMVELPGGTFQMGSPSYEGDRQEDEGPVREVRIKAFRLGKFEVTRGEFGRFVSATGYRTEAERNVDVPDSAGDWAKGANPGCRVPKSDGQWGWVSGTSWRDPGFEQGDDHPVVCVSWNDAKAYIEWLNGETGRRYRLPSEAEQEYAIRAGSRSPYAWGSDANGACAYANVADQSGAPNGQGWSDAVSCSDGSKGTSTVGRYRANGFGLHDTVGNVWEWGQDCYRDSYPDAPVDGSAYEAGGCERRVLRGAAWSNEPAWLRSAGRYGNRPAFRSLNIGFRLAEDL